MCDSPFLVALHQKEDGKRAIEWFGKLAEPRNMWFYNNWRDRRDFVLLGCGKCRSCLMRRAKEWCIRCKDELRYHEDSCFVTLTYNDRWLPMLGDDAELERGDYQKFLKRLRKHISSAGKVCPHLASTSLRYFGCGEYGRLHGRPHFHFILFGWRPYDMYPWKYTGRALCFRSPILDRLWSVDGEPIGYASVGDVSDESIAYVCRYSLKKLDMKCDHDVRPFTVASTRPAIGRRFFEEFSDELLVKNENGDIVRYGHFDGSGFTVLPRFYSKLLSEEDKEAVARFFNNELSLLCSEELRRRVEFSRYRARLHNTHYGRDVLEEPTPQEENEDEQSCCDSL